MLLWFGYWYVNVKMTSLDAGNRVYILEWRYNSTLLPPGASEVKWVNVVK